MGCDNCQTGVIYLNKQINKQTEHWKNPDYIFQRSVISGSQNNTHEHWSAPNSLHLGKLNDSWGGVGGHA